MMKKMFLLAAAVVALGGCSSDKYVVEGDIAGLDGTLYLFDGEKVVDSAVVADGRFRFEGRAGKGGLRYLLDSREGLPQAFAVQLYLEPGTISVAADAENPNLRHVTGTPANDACDAYTSSYIALIGEYDDPATTDERREAIRGEYERLTRRTLGENRDNYFGVMLLAQNSYDLSGQEILDEIALFSDRMRQTRELSDLEAMARQKLKTDVGQPYIDIGQPDAEGNAVSLKSVIGNPANKYVLVDFWASWCGPCMNEVPHLKKTYDAFHGKGFEIYAVSLDNNRERWLGAVEEHGMGWIHVSDLGAFDNRAARDYGVRSIPSNFLLDAEGRIIAKDLRGEALYDEIAGLLGE